MSLAVDVVAEARRAQVLLHPARLELLEHLDEPSSAAALARRLGQPRQRVNYHLRELATARLVELVESRRTGSVVERTWRRTGRAYAISTDALGRLGTTPETVQDRFSAAFQVALASRAVRDLGVLQEGAAAAEQRLATFALEVEVRFATPAARAAFREELTAAVAAVVERHHDASAPEGRDYRVYLGAYPRVKADG